jgi:hypothetical protein
MFAATLNLTVCPFPLDTQDSTTIYETLPPEVADHVVGLCNRVTRTLLDIYDGWVEQCNCTMKMQHCSQAFDDSDPAPLEDDVSPTDVFDGSHRGWTDSLTSPL